MNENEEEDLKEIQKRKKMKLLVVLLAFLTFTVFAASVSAYVPIRVIGNRVDDSLRGQLLSINVTKYYYPNPPIGGGGPGQPCQNDTDCWDGACGLITAAPNAPYLCCPSGCTVYFMNIEFCTGMAPGNDCWINAMCGSYCCQGNNYGKSLGNCT